jgi:hypothetical protein
MGTGGRGGRHGHRWMAGGTAKLDVIQGGRSCTKKMLEVAWGSWTLRNEGEEVAQYP